MPTVSIPLLPPHSERQRTLIQYPGNVVIFAGRRWGKTDANIQRIYRSMSRDPGLYWWVGLSWKSASMKRAWRGAVTIARKVLAAMGLDERSHINRSKYEIILPGMGEIWFRTADNPPSLAGEGIRGAVLDEFSLMAEIVWTEYVQATLLDYGGWASFAGVPKGRNWAANLYHAAGDRDDWAQIRATSYDNPFMQAARIDRIKETTSERVFQQEYLAEILPGEGAVFRNITACLNAPGSMPGEHTQHKVIAGVDWGKSSDFTAISIGCYHCRMELARDRFNQIDYSFQRERLASLCGEWGVKHILAESNAMGEPVIDQLYREGLPIAGFATTASSKPPLIENLALALEREEWRFQDDPIWTSELEAYEQQVNPHTGRSTYGAPTGIHDDTVIARALMLMAAQEKEYPPMGAVKYA